MSCSGSSPAHRPARSRPPGAVSPASTTQTSSVAIQLPSRVATRQMAEINAAYEQLRDDRVGVARPAHQGATRRPGGPPPPKPTRPVTARLDTTDILRPRNATTSRPDGRRAHPPGQPPIRARVGDTGPAAGVGSERAARPIATPALPAATPAEPRDGDHDRHAVRQVPRPHARRDRGVRAVLRRLDGVDDLARSGAPGRRPGPARRPRPAGDRPTIASVAPAARAPDRLIEGSAVGPG